MQTACLPCLLLLLLPRLLHPSVRVRRRRRSVRRGWGRWRGSGEGGREEVGLGGIWAEGGWGKRRKREKNRERVERKQLHRQTNERTNERAHSFAAEFTTDASEIARPACRSWREEAAAHRRRPILQCGQVSTPHWPNDFIFPAYL